MTKCHLPLKNQNENISACKITASTVIPTSMKPFSIVIPTKCPAITLARQREDELSKVISKAFQMYKPNEVMLSFNGGKDCTVVLHALDKFFRNKPLEHLRLPILYIQTDDNFPEIDQFVEECVNFYNINLIKRKGSIKTVLADVMKDMPHIKAVFMGNRRTDPYCRDLHVMQATDPEWPPLMRINPILDWSYVDVWTYIFIFKVPYCVLYEQGYTSIGTKKNTLPNPHLKVFNVKQSCSSEYSPAYFLEDESLERAGRFTVVQKEENNEEIR